MKHPAELLDEDEYSAAVAQGQKGFAQSVIVLLLVISIFGMTLILAAGAPRLHEPNIMQLVISGMRVLQTMVPNERVMAILGVLATVGIAHAVSTRSLPSEVRNIQTTPTNDKTKLLDSVRRASRLQSALFASTLFSVLGAALSALVALLSITNNDIAAAAASGLLTLFLFLELVRLFDATEDINEFKNIVSSKDKSAYRKSFTKSSDNNFKSIAWYTSSSLAIVLPIGFATAMGHGEMALRIAIGTVVAWGFGISVSISYVRGTISVTLSSRLAARTLGTLVFLVVWLFSAQVTLELMSDEDGLTSSLVYTYAAAHLFFLAWALLRIWGESGWLLLRNFAAQHSEIILSAGSASLDKLSWNDRPKYTIRCALLILTILAAPPIAYAMEQAPRGSAFYPTVLFVISLIFSSTARWSLPTERTVNYILAVALIVATILRGLEDLGPSHPVICAIVIAGGVMMVLVSSAIVWDRDRKVLPLRPVLTLVDLDFARRYHQDSIELDLRVVDRPSSAGNQNTHLLARNSEFPKSPQSNS